jgi:peptidoglycan hydrolase CwlO-like protein
MEKTEAPGIYKERDGILINRDNEALAAYKKRLRKERSIDHMQEEMAELKNDIQEIKDLLKGLVK